MDLQKNRRRPGSGTGPIFRSCVNKSRLQQLPQPKRLSGQVVMNGSSAHLVDANIPFLVDQINVSITVVVLKDFVVIETNMVYFVCL